MSSKSASLGKGDSPRILYETIEEFDFDSLLFGNLATKFDRVFRPNRWALSSGQVLSIVFSMLEGGDPPDGNTPAGYTYIGQLITHDIVPATKHDERVRKVTPALNLDSLYFDFNAVKHRSDILTEIGEFRLNEEISGFFETHYDLPRHEGKALIPEIRNDNNLIVSQLHLIWLRLHNKAVHFLAAKMPQRPTSFYYHTSKAFVTLLFQRMVVDDFLKHVLHPRIYESYFLDSNNYFSDYRAEGEFRIPLEFSHSAFRFGHSMVRAQYELNGNGIERLENIFRPAQSINCKHAIEWSRFFDFEGKEPAQRASRLDLRLASQFTDPIIVPPNLDLSADGRNESMGYIADYFSSIDTTAQSPSLEFKMMAAHIIFSDIEASQEVPTGGDLLNLLTRAQTLNRHEGQFTFFSDMRIPTGNVYRKILDFNDSILPKSVGLTVDKAPLWLFALREAELFPYTDEWNFPQADLGGKFEAARPPSSDGERLGAITSLIVAEVLQSSIRESEVNIFNAWSKTERQIAGLESLYVEILNDFKQLRMADLLKVFDLM